MKTPNETTASTPDTFISARQKNTFIAKKYGDPKASSTRGAPAGASPRAFLALSCRGRLLRRGLGRQACTGREKVSGVFDAATGIDALVASSASGYLHIFSEVKSGEDRGCHERNFVVAVAFEEQFHVEDSVRKRCAKEAPDHTTYCKAEERHPTSRVLDDIYGTFIASHSLFEEEEEDESSTIVEQALPLNQCGELLWSLQALQNRNNGNRVGRGEDCAQKE
jgi:hypothetical protein